MGANMSTKVEKEIIRFLYKNIFIILKSDDEKNTKKNKIIELIDGAVK